MPVKTKVPGRMAWKWDSFNSTGCGANEVSTRPSSAMPATGRTSASACANTASLGSANVVSLNVRPSSEKPMSVALASLSVICAMTSN